MPRGGGWSAQRALLVHIRGCRPRRAVLVATNAVALTFSLALRAGGGAVNDAPPAWRPAWLATAEAERLGVAVRARDAGAQRASGGGGWGAVAADEGGGGGHEGGGGIAATRIVLGVILAQAARVACKVSNIQVGQRSGVQRKGGIRCCAVDLVVRRGFLASVASLGSGEAVLGGRQGRQGERLRGDCFGDWRLGVGGGQGGEVGKDGGAGGGCAGER